MQISSLTSEFCLRSLMLLGSALQCYFPKVALMFILVPAWSLLGSAVLFLGVSSVVRLF